MPRKTISISEAQEQYLRSCVAKTGKRAGNISESALVRVALDVFSELPIDFNTVKDEESLRRESLKLIKLAANAFKALKSHLRVIDYHDLLMEKTPDGVYMVDEKGNFTLINKVAQRRMGYSQADLMGKHFSKIVAPDYQEMVNEYLQRRIEGEDAPERYTIEILAKNGEKFPVEVNITPMTDEKGAIVAVFGVAREILPDEI